MTDPAPTQLGFRTGHTLPDLTDNHVAAVRSALTEASHRITLRGTTVQLLDCHYATTNGQLTCTFTATHETSVRHAIELAQLPTPTRCEPVHP